MFLLTSSVFAQTNYNTILVPKHDTIQKINLRLKKKERLETTGNILFAGGVLSTIVLYQTNPGSPWQFIAPVSLCVMGFITMGIASKYEDDVEDEINN